MILIRQVLRILRGLSYLFNYIIFELPRGLDISLRDKGGVTLQGNNGYALTSKSALKNMLKDVDLVNKKFLDIGSGKGGVIIYAKQLGCKISSGIEYENSLHQIAINNLKILNMLDFCSSIKMDARHYKSYAEFDILFMFNPFDDEIYEEVVKQIASQLKLSKDINERYLICYGGANINSVISTGIFKLVREEYCPYRANLFRVFKTIKISDEKNKTSIHH
jgi:16S rRNA G966 N2-methylase RsmD